MKKVLHLVVKAAFIIALYLIMFNLAPQPESKIIINAFAFRSILAGCLVGLLLAVSPFVFDGSLFCHYFSRPRLNIIHSGDKWVVVYEVEKKRYGYGDRNLRKAIDKAILFHEELAEKFSEEDLAGVATLKTLAETLGPPPAFLAAALAGLGRPGEVRPAAPMPPLPADMKAAVRGLFEEIEKDMEKDMLNELAQGGDTGVDPE